MYHLLPFLLLLTSATGDGNFRFTSTHVIVNETPFTQASFGISRTGGQAQPVTLTCQILNSSAQSDVDGTTQNTVFGSNVNSGSCDFTIVNDVIPEVNETFTVQLIVSQGSGTVVSPSLAYLTILANDDAFGIIGFNETGPLVVAEPTGQGGLTVIRLSRKAGDLGTVQVSWKVANGPNNGADDFLNTSGVVIFEQGQRIANLSIQLNPDNVAENEESFTLTLESPQGGAELDQNAASIIIRIPANDVPLEFPLVQFYIPENQSRVEIEVFRGLEADGITTVGPVNEVTSVDWYLASGSATAGNDFVDGRGTLTFQSGETKNNITVRLINDNNPEPTENFTVHLANASLNSYIKPPGIATVVLLPNDDHNGVLAFGQHTRILDEDGVRSGTFHVNRSAGTFGAITVSWKIQGADASSIFETTSGMLNFAPGQSSVSFQIVVREDSAPEEAKEFYVQLYNVTGGARLENTLTAQRARFFVADSDDVYGVFEFASDHYQSINMDSIPRQLHLNITRTGGMVGSVGINITVTYHLPGSSIPSNEVTLDYNGDVTIAAGSRSTVVVVRIADNGFIKLGAAFKAELIAVRLLSGASPLTSEVPPSSPKIGSKSEVFLNVTAKDANGEVGFSTAHQMLSVQEPAGPASSFLQLAVKRSGTANRVVVHWNITSNSNTFFPNDTGPQRGKIVFEEGQDEVNITIEIKPDETPEVAEVFTVNLVNVSDMDRIQVGADKAQVTIEESDNPGGSFEFKNSTAVVLQESSSNNFINIGIVRKGSALDTRWVSFGMVPSGSDDFFGSTKTVEFKPGEFEKQFPIIVRNDNLPEIDEMFVLRLSSTGPVGQMGVLGNKITVNITIKANDDPHGVIGFRSSNIIKTIAESKYSTERASFEVYRARGTFGQVTVTWNVTADNGANTALDVSPISGQVTFSAGETSKNIIIDSLPDMIPETNESFRLYLNNISSNARWGDQSLRKATLIISKNDDAVYFAQPTLIKVGEGQYANMTIQRGGDGTSIVDVYYQTFDGTATSSADYQATTGQVRFNIGEFQKSISILVSDDSTPEGVETFTVNLTNSTGDTVLYGDTSVTVSIFASDGGTGDFQFASNSLNKTTTESAAVDFTIERKNAQFGMVRVYWQVLRLFPDASTTELLPGEEFTKVSDYVTFADGSSSEVLRLTPREDGIAEQDESFEIRLVNATGIDTGEDGTIISPSSAFLEITANDDPNGLLKFQDRSLDIPEDFLPGMEATTEKNLTVLRNQGTWGTVRVAWEVQTAPESLARSDQAYDLFLLGSMMPGVSSVPAQRRANTGTYVYCFDGTNNESFVEVSGLTGLDRKFSVRMWVNATKGKNGYVLASVAGSTVNFALSLNTTGSSTLAKFVYLTNTTEISFGKDIADGSWHLVVFTVDTDSNTVQFYLDGTAVGSPRSIPSGSFSSGAVYRVGKGLNSEPQFTGCIQDITVYPEVLIADSIGEMAKPNKQLTPINGYLTFNPGVAEQKVSIHTVDDNDPEDDTPYTVVLYSPKGGARLETISAEFKMRLEVLKSDNANGLFGFISTDPVVIPESSNASLNIVRQKGQFGSATVSWSVYKSSTSSLAVNDFVMASGTVVFDENESDKTLVIPVNDDMIPEVDEHFTVNLTSVVPTDGSTPTSAASLRPGFTEVNITIRESDYPNGLLQFMSSVPVTNETISPSTSQFNLDVRESAGVLTLHVVRAQGTLGNVKCQWKTTAGTAKSPEDFTGSTGAVEFAAGSRNSTINITIIDDNIPELSKTFRVELFNPEGGAQLNAVAKTAHVTILPSDDAFGVISFAPDSLSRTVSEASGSTVHLTVQRTGGLLGPSTVYWQVSGQGAQDVENTNGSVVLAVSRNSTQIAIRIKEDADPELAESFLVHLTNVSAGRLADRGTQSNITILASDDPYGVFIFSPSQLTVDETDIVVNFSIKRISGTNGVVLLNYSSISEDMPNMRMATPNVDYVPIEGAVEFSEGQKNATISVIVLDDATPEAAESIMVNITDVQLVGGHPVYPFPDNSPRVGTSRVAQLVIRKNDNANGVVQLSSNAVSVHEPHSGAIVNLTRTAGDFGTIYVAFEVVAQSANGSDYRILSQNVTLVEQQRVAEVPVEIVHDMQPEFNENFKIRLISAYGGAVLGSRLECTVTILENDYPYGLIGFDNDSLSKSVQERSSPNQVTLRVIRRFGLRGGSRIHWEARLRGVLASDDITPVEGDLVFAQGESSHNIVFDVQPDSVPEVLEVIDVNLTSVTFLSEGTPSLDESTRVARVRIEPNDAPHGVVEFAQGNYNVSEGRTAYLLVSRQFGTAGDIRVFYSAIEHVGGNQATPNVDFNATTNNSVIIPSGETSANITLAIFDDPNPELSELFDVELEHVELVGQTPAFPPQLGALKRAAVTIVTSDDAHGLMVIKAANPDAGSHGSRTTVNETDSLSVVLVIERLRGTIGAVTVGVEVQQKGATLNSDFIASGSTRRFADKDNSSQSFIVSIKGDDIPEPDEEIVIKLVNPTGGARVATGLGNNVTIIIQANDGVAGKVGFDERSRSIVVREGGQVYLSVNRTLSVGRVSVDWRLTGDNASLDFVSVNGTVTFNEGETHTSIHLSVRNDSTPETYEVFVVHLNNLQTFGIASAGHASFIQGKTTATISISASDRPHGVIELEAGSRMVTRNDERNFTLTVSRLFGNIGAIRVYYEAVRGNTTSLQSSKTLATPGEDFVAGQRSIIIDDKQDVGTIPVWIKDDNVPELGEVFLVNITRVELVDSSQFNDTIPPLLGSYRVAQITLSPNDNPHGVFKFPQAKIYVTESGSPYTITILRDQGTFGQEQVNYFVQTHSASLNDFNITGYSGGEQTLVFASGVKEQNITIFVTDDSTPEGDETLTITLTRNSGETLLGNPKVLEVVIRANDDAYGVFSLSPSSLSKTIAEPGTGPVNEADFVVVRGVDSYGTVVVYWEVLNGSAETDLSPVRGNVTFQDGDTQRSFRVAALLDSTPEKAETFIIKLNISGNGRLTSPYEAQVTITENDSPYGELEIVSSSSLSSSVDIEETQSIVKAKVIRSKGDFGRITLNYQTASQTANSSSGDVVHFEKLQLMKTMGAYSWHTFSAFGDQFVLLAGNNRTGALPEGVDDGTVSEYLGSALFRWQGVLVPLQVFPDNSPRVGTSRVAQLVIRKNDNANGVVQLSSNAVSVHEPHSGAIVNLTRTAGDFGTIYVAFEVVAQSANGSDYRILSQNVTLVEQQRVAEVPVEIVHDMQPEFNENFKIRLISAYGGAVLGSRLECTVTILENDYPYGLIGFDNDSLSKSVQERSSPNQVTLRVIRRFGLRGGSRIHWEARLRGVLASDDITPVEGDLVFAQGESSHNIVFDVQPDSVPEVLEVIDVNLTSVTFLSEGTPSLDESTRVARVRIEPNDAPHGVVEFAQGNYNVSEGRTAYLLVSRQFGTAGDIRVFYSAIEHVGGNQATPNVDFNATTNNSVIIPSGETSANITLAIFDDPNPELSELFDVELEHVELVGQTPAFPPQLGALKRAAVTIVTSDDAHGLMVIKAANPDAGSHGSRTTVNETDSLSVVLVIERLRGTIGAVTVGVEVQQKGATLNSDFIASGSTRRFADKDNSSQSFIVSIKGDDIPEPDEEIVIKLVNPTGGARVATGLGNNVTIIIQANDGVAGKVGFDERSRSIVVREGGQVYLSVNRTLSVGRVSVDWRLTGDNASLDFVSVNGTVTFNEGETHTSIHLSVRNDSTPETYEVFVVHLNNLQTFGIASAGHASFIQGKTTATISISASDRPHGVIELEAGSRMVTRNDERNFTLTVSRLFGNIGAIRVYYEAVRGNTTSLQSSKTLATPGEDFVAGQRSIIIDDKQDVGTIPVWIKDDNVPELGEVFLVNITRVELVDSSQFNDTIPPLLGSYRVAQITLSPNDNPHGVFKFPQAKIYVTESGSPYTITILRDQGTFGQEQVNYFVQTHSASLNDFNITGYSGGEQTLVFASGVKEQNITIFVTDDSTPEGDETLTITLTRNSGETLLGNPKVLEVVIRANDDAYGVFSLSPSSLSKTIAEPGTGPVNEADFVVVRGVDSYGTVVVYWEVLNGSAETDLSPVRGNVTFQDGDTQRSFRVAALLDSTPEKAETFIIKLNISGNGRLTSPYEAQVTITENDSPYGELEIVSSSSLSSSVDIEETQSIVKAKVIRSKGDFGRITLNYQTASQTANSSSGDVVHFEKLQLMKTMGAYSWHTFSAFGDQFVLLAGNNRTGALPEGVDDGTVSEYLGSALFRWQGVLVPLQNIVTDGAVAWDTLVVGDKVYLAVANHGSDGRYETYSRIYTMDNTGMLTVIQNISTQGASDVKFFSPPGQSDIYLIVANQMDNAGETHISSQVYKWAVDRFTPENVNVDNTRSASNLAVFVTAGTLKVAIAFYHDKASGSFQTKSPVYEWRTNSFSLLQEIDTNGPVGVEHFEHSGQSYLVFANSKSTVDIYRWNSNRFDTAAVQSISIQNVQSAKPYVMQGNAYLLTVDSSGHMNVYMWDSVSKFTLQMNTTVEDVQTATPFVTVNDVAGNTALFLAAVFGKQYSPALRPVRLSPQADFIPRQGQLIFEDGQKELELDFTVLPDNTPERDETFAVRIYNASGKAIVNTQKQELTINILSNDDAHGRIGFAPSSLTKVNAELAADSTVTFEVIREYGSLGRVVVLWNVSGNISNGDISPMFGELVFDNGETTQNISLTVHRDMIPELLEVAYVRLLRLTETGSADSNRGAVLNTARTTAMLVIPANDDPHGIISWKNSLIISQDNGPKNVTLSVSIMRQFGLIGDLVVAYETVQLSSVANNDEQPAVAGVDYKAVTSTVDILAGMNSTHITLDISHYTNTLIKKIFQVNLTSVTLKQGFMVSNSPRINPNSRLLEVVIAQPNQTAGELNFDVAALLDPATQTIMVDENVGMLNITVQRTGSLSGTVGFRFIVRPLISNIYAAANNSDFSPSDGTVMFAPGISSVMFNISIVNDNVPEIEEGFYVQISRPLGGVQIGPQSKVDVIVKPNDDPYGRFGFTKAISDGINVVQEGNTLRLEVKRERGTYRDVHVNWKIVPNAGITNANSQISPMNGSIVFKQGDKSQFIVLHAVDDSVAEEGQSFTCQLVSADNGGVLDSELDEATVYIPANDKVEGVVSIDPSARNIIAGEPMQGYDGVFVVRLQRRIGQSGNAQVTWEVTSQTAGVGPSPASTFNATSDSVTMPSGVETVLLPLKVRDDATAEELAVYTFTLTGATQTVLDPSQSARRATITVVASDDPYGIVEFQSATPLNVSEDIGFVNLTVLRNGGSIGQLSVNYSVSSDTATEGADYESFGSVLIFAEREDQKTISVLIKRDNIPELSETIKVQLLGVQLVSASPLNYSVIDGLQLNTPPTINSAKSEVQIVIKENDEARGIIRFTQSAMVVREKIGTAVLQLVREGGSLGVVDVRFTVHNGTAFLGEDFALSGGVIQFSSGQSSSSINVSIVDDDIPEQRESFTVTLDSVTGGAKLSPPTTVTVTIETSDDPSGLFGFVNASQLSLENPSISKDISFIIEREGGAEGEVEVSWKLVRLHPPCSSCVLSEDFEGPTNGSELFPNGVTGAQKTVNLRVRPFLGHDEPEERFVLMIYKVSGNGSIDSLQSNITITIAKHGFPNGVFKFDNTATLTFTEPDSGVSTKHFRVVRDEGRQGTVNVNWQITGPSGGVKTTSGTVTFPENDFMKNIVVEITSDDVPELEAAYRLKIVSVDGGADIDPARNNLTFIISANDNPHGVFKLQLGAQTIQVEGNNRKLQFTVEREMGTFGAVDVQYQVRHSEWYPTEMQGSVTVPDGERQVSKNITLSAFLRFGSSFTVSLTRVSYSANQVPATSIAPQLSSGSQSDTREVVLVPEEAANAVFKFTDNSLKLNVGAGNVVSSITVVREGLFGSVAVDVAQGSPTGTFPNDFGAGQLVINGSPLSFTGSRRNVTFSATVQPMLVPDRKLVYSLYLVTTHTAPADLPGGANITSGASRTAVIEYSGVVVIAPDSQRLAALEGGTVKCKALRQYSVLGSITVHYTFLGTPGSFSMAQGVFTTEFNVNVPDSDNNPQKDRVLYLNLTSVTGSHSPRLGVNRTVRISVTDNDDPQGVFSFRNPRITVPENATSGNSRMVELEIQRTKGTFGAVSVLVRSVGGGEPWNPSLQSLKSAVQGKGGEKNATIGLDYVELSARVNFPNEEPVPAEGQVKRVQLEIKDDQVPEPDEVVIVYLTDATGGARVASDADSGLQPWAAITIQGNDLMNGEIGFVPGSQTVTIDEDGSRTGVLKVQRTKATFGTVQVSWSVRESNFRDEVEASRGIITFSSGVRETDLVIRLRDDNVPERAGQFHVDLTEIISGSQARINSQARSAIVNVLDSDFPNGTIAFRKDSIFKAVDKTSTEVQVEVRRGQGTDTDVTVFFKTRDLAVRVNTKPGVDTYQALAGEDYTVPTTKSVRFAKGEVSKFISITLTPKSASATKYPKAFEVVLLNVTGGAKIIQEFNTSMVIISDNQDTTEFLKLRALAIQTPLTDDDIYRILSELHVSVQKTLDEDRLQLSRDTINAILSYKKSLETPANRKLEDRSKQKLMDIFDELLNPERDDTKGQDKLSQEFEMFAFSLLYGLPCTDSQSASITGTRASVEGFRQPPAQLNGLQIKPSNGKSYFQYPSNFLTASSSSGSDCTDIHFIDYQTAHWFKKTDQPPIISDKVFSTSLNQSSSSLISSRNPITYRIYTSNKRVTPKGADCVFWDTSASAWSKEGCTKKSDEDDYVECQCEHLSIFAAEGNSDNRTGYELYFRIVCFVCMAAFAVAVIIHHLCSVANMFAAKLLMHLFFAGMMAQLMFVLGAYLSPTLVGEYTRCSVLAMFFHYFFLCQFTWMFVEAWNMWRVFVLNDEHTDRKFVWFFVLGWGSPVVVIVLYIMVTQLGFDWAFTKAYADVHDNGDMCFIPNAYAALAAAIGPVLPLLMGVAVVFTQAYQVTPQWKYYDDIFRGHYNIREIRYIMVLFALITLVWLFAGLHLAFGSEWMIIVFTILDAILALYVVIWYCCLRNQLRGVFKESFAIPSVPPPIELRDDMFRDSPSPGHSISSLKRSGMRNSPDDPVYLTRIERRKSASVGYNPNARIIVSDWDDLDLGVTPKGSRKMLVNMDDTDSLGRVNEMYEDDDFENRDLDDLVFALKTGGQFEREPTYDDEKPELDGSGQGQEHYEMRRISIADTHL